MTDEELRAFKQKYPERFAVLEKQAKKGALTPTQQKKAAYMKRFYVEHKKEMNECMKRWYEEHKEEKAEYAKQWGEEHPVYMKRYYEEHKEEILEQQRQYREVNKEKIAVQQRQYLEANKEGQREYHRWYYEANKEEMGECMRRYRREHPEVRQRARARRVDAEGSFTAEELRLKYAEFDNRCVYCGDVATLTPDHMIPLSRGGSNYIDNVVPACYACNVKKSAMTSEEFFASIDVGREEGVLIRRYINEHPEIVGEVT